MRILGWGGLREWTSVLVHLQPVAGCFAPQMAIANDGVTPVSTAASKNETFENVK
jgi:hypothetical protein